MENKKININHYLLDGIDSSAEVQWDIADIKSPRNTNSIVKNTRTT